MAFVLCGDDLSVTPGSLGLVVCENPAKSPGRSAAMKSAALDVEPAKLHNNHNVYILGAGFSRFSGLPLIGDFMMKMRDALEYHANLGHKRECGAIEAVLSFRLKSSSAAYRVQIDLENIEELFSLASASPSPMEESIKLAIAATLDYSINTSKRPLAKFRATQTCMTARPNWQWDYMSQPDGMWTVPAYEYIVRALLGVWRDDLPGGENSFITFNYDTILEETLEALGVGYWLGFDGLGKDRRTRGASVFKLHGSVNWAIPKGARTKIEVRKDYRSVVDEGLTPQIIPPTWKKDSRGAFDDIWNHSLQALSDATRVVVIGFSIPPTDQHFKYLLAAGLQENYSLREIVFINPADGMGLVQERCETLFANQKHNAAKLRFVNLKVEDFVGQGTDLSHVWSISRPIPDLQGLQYASLP